MTKRTIEIDAHRYFVETVYTEEEVNYVISDTSGFLFRLVPEISNASGFDISSADKKEGVPVDQNVVNKISEAIMNHEL